MQRNHYDITVQIKDPDTGKWTNLATWDKSTGGDVTSTTRKYQPGGGAKEIVLGGRRTRADLTISRLCDVDRDWPLIANLENWSGIADVIITQQATRANFDTSGIKPRPMTGKLIAVKLPDPDSESEDPGQIEITCSVTA